MDINKCSVHMYGTKVEITMAKAEPGSWSHLDFPRKDKLPPPVQNFVPVKQDTNSSDDESKSDDDFNLDDLTTVTNGVQLSELASTKKY